MANKINEKEGERTRWPWIATIEDAPTIKGHQSMYLGGKVTYPLLSAETTDGSKPARAFVMVSAGIRS